jgi:nitrogen regulatory protein P-II 2
MKLVTIIAEAFARDAILNLLHIVGAHGYTLSQVEGSGARGERTAEMPELANIRVEVVVPPDVSTALMGRLQAEFFPRYAMVVYETDIRVIRSEKF